MVATPKIVRLDSGFLFCLESPRSATKSTPPTLLISLILSVDFVLTSHQPLYITGHIVVPWTCCVYLYFINVCGCGFLYLLFFFHVLKWLSFISSFLVFISMLTYFSLTTDFKIASFPKNCIPFYSSEIYLSV